MDAPISTKIAFTVRECAYSIPVARRKKEKDAVLYAEMLRGLMGEKIRLKELKRLVDTRPIATPQELAEHICELNEALVMLWMKAMYLSSTFEGIFPLIQRIESEEEGMATLETMKAWNELLQEMFEIGEKIQKWSKGDNKAYNFPMGGRENMTKEVIYPVFLKDTRLSPSTRGILITMFENLTIFGRERKEIINILQEYTTFPREETNRALDELLKTGYILIQTRPENGLFVGPLEPPITEKREGDPEVTSSAR